MAGFLETVKETVSKAIFTPEGGINSIGTLITGGLAAVGMVLGNFIFPGGGGLAMGAIFLGALGLYAAGGKGSVENKNENPFGSINSSNEFVPARSGPQQNIKIESVEFTEDGKTIKLDLPVIPKDAIHKNVDSLIESQKKADHKAVVSLKNNGYLSTTYARKLSDMIHVAEQSSIKSQELSETLPQSLRPFANHISLFAPRMGDKKEKLLNMSFSKQSMLHVIETYAADHQMDINFDPKTASMSALIDTAERALSERIKTLRHEEYKRADGTIINWGKTVFTLGYGEANKIGSDKVNEAIKEFDNGNFNALDSIATKGGNLTGNWTENYSLKGYAASTSGYVDTNVINAAKNIVEMNELVQLREKLYAFKAEVCKDALETVEASQELNKQLLQMKKDAEAEKAKASETTTPAERKDDKKPDPKAASGDVVFDSILRKGFDPSKHPETMPPVPNEVNRPRDLNINGVV